ncbi:MAG TPA: hypothetical protein VNZ50_11580 [Hyphomicrobiaceae bacterium]|jgi:hypothetical protein|nr:hypothetical protein [Hyphomicrobiaceae bacterium]
MASARWRSRREVQLAYDAILALADDEFDVDEPAGEGSGLDPHYIDLPCYVPLLDEDGLEPFALDAQANERND